MPTYNIKEIKSMKLFSLDGNEVLDLGVPISTIEETSTNESFYPIHFLPNEFSFTLNLSEEDYYKARNALVAGGAKKYRYKQIQKALKLM